MTNNDILRRLRYILHADNPALIEIFKLDHNDISTESIDKFLTREEDEAYEECPNPILNSFLDGLITLKRGPQDPSKAPTTKPPFTNNLVLRKLRIAFELKDTDIIAALEMAGLKMSKSEISAFFRSENHRHYMPCQEQVLRKFLSGLEKKLKNNKD